MPCSIGSRHVVCRVARLVSNITAIVLYRPHAATPLSIRYEMISDFRRAEVGGGHATGIRARLHYRILRQFSLLHLLARKITYIGMSLNAGIIEFSGYLSAL